MSADIVYVLNRLKLGLSRAPFRLAQRTFRSDAATFTCEIGVSLRADRHLRNFVEEAKDRWCHRWLSPIDYFQFARRHLGT